MISVASRSYIRFTSCHKNVQFNELPEGSKAATALEQAVAIASLSTETDFSSNVLGLRPKAFHVAYEFGPRRFTPWVPMLCFALILRSHWYLINAAFPLSVKQHMAHTCTYFDLTMKALCIAYPCSSWAGTRAEKEVWIQSSKHWALHGFASTEVGLWTEIRPGRFFFAVQISGTISQAVGGQ